MDTVATHSKSKMGREMARTPVLAAGGIVLRQEETPLIAVVRLRKRNEWVLPKGKLDDGETPRDAAEREVLEETGHEVAVHEFLGTLVYESGGRSKVVHYWRMEAGGEPARELMNDVKAVDWLPLEDAVERLSRLYERAFLENVGPIALSAAALTGAVRRPREKQPAPGKRRSRAVAASPSAIEPSPASPLPDPVSSPVVHDERTVMNGDVEAETSVPAMQLIIAPSFAPEIEPAVIDTNSMQPLRDPRRNLIQRVRDWLRRAA
jgi:8-oxo-dGTP diphosphatase